MGRWEDWVHPQGLQSAFASGQRVCVSSRMYAGLHCTRTGWRLLRGHWPSRWYGPCHSRRPASFRWRTQLREDDVGGRRGARCGGKRCGLVSAACWECSAWIGGRMEEMAQHSSTIRKRTKWVELQMDECGLSRSLLLCGETNLWGDGFVYSDITRR